VSVIDTEPQEEQKILVGGIPIPISMAGKAVSRCIRAIQITDELLKQGFAGEEDLQKLRAGLTGEDEEQNVATPDGVVK
jgi:hypothetical protein